MLNSIKRSRSIFLLIDLMLRDLLSIFLQLSTLCLTSCVRRTFTAVKLSDTAVCHDARISRHNAHNPEILSYGSEGIYDVVRTSITKSYKLQSITRERKREKERTVYLKEKLLFRKHMRDLKHTFRILIRTYS